MNSPSKLFCGGIAAVVLALSAPPATANSSPQDGYIAALNAACRYKRIFNVNSDSALLYIAQGVSMPDGDYIDNWAQANRVSKPIAGSYMLGFIDYITSQGSQEVIRTLRLGIKRRCPYDGNLN